MSADSVPAWPVYCSACSRVAKDARVSAVCSAGGIVWLRRRRVILRRQCLVARVSLVGIIAAEHRLSLNLTTSMNLSFKIPARGVGVTSPLRLSHSVIHLGAAVAGEVLTSSVFLTNTSAKSGAFESL